jgi:hypothetical protein
MVLASVDPDFMDRDDVRMMQHRRREQSARAVSNVIAGRDL